MKNRLMPSFLTRRIPVKWIGSDDPTLINDERFAPAGVLAPNPKLTLRLYYMR